MNKLGVGVIILKDIYSEDTFKVMLENHFISMSRQLYNKLREELGVELPEGTMLKLEIGIKPYLEDIDVDLR